MATDTIHYVPMFLTTVMFTILTTMVAFRVSTIVANPDVFMKPAIKAAAEEVSMVCDGKLSARTLSSAPPGSSYVFTTCGQRNLAITTSSIVMVAQLASAASDLSKIGSKGGEVAETLGKNADKFDEMVSGATEGADGIMVFKDFFSVSDEAAGSVDEIVAMSDEAVDIAEDSTDAAQSASRNLQEGANDLSDSADDLGDAAGSGTRQGNDLAIDCTDNPDACAKIFDYGDKLKDASKLMSKFQEATRGLKAFENIEDAVKAMKRANKEWSHFSRLQKVGWALDDMRTSIKNWRKSERTIRHTFQEFSEKFAWRYLTVKALRILERNNDVVQEYIYEREYVFEMLLGEFIGVAYTPVMITVVNTTSPEVDEIANQSRIMVGNLTEFALSFKDNASTKLKGFGYYDSSSFLNDIEDFNIISIGSKTSLNPGIVPYLLGEYTGRVQQLCLDDEECGYYRRDLLEMGMNYSTGDVELDDLKWQVITYNNEKMNFERDKFVEILDFIAEMDDAAKEAKKAADSIREDLNSWMKSNCEITALQLADYGEVKVTDCALVIDCTPGSFCFVGLPVVESNPTDPDEPDLIYLTISSLEDETDASTIINLVGMSYDSGSKITTPGFFGGCPASMANSENIFMCLTAGLSRRCQVVPCGQHVNIVPKAFDPAVRVEDTGDNIKISGSFATWT